MEKMTATQAAEMIGITPYSVWRLLRDKKLMGKKFGTVWMVDRESVEDYIKRNKGKATHDPTRA